MYIPEQASADHKLPLVIVQHGSQHNLQMQDMNMVELARRGFIVISGDAFGHGSSTPRGFVDPSMNFANMRYLLEYACNNLDCVDMDKIGICGHSMGAAITTTTLKYYVEQEARGLGVNWKLVMTRSMSPILLRGLKNQFTRILIGASLLANTTNISSVSPMRAMILPIFWKARRHWTLSTR